MTGRPGDETDTLCGQVLTVGDHGINDIRGFDDRNMAAATASRPG